MMKEKLCPLKCIRAELDTVNSNLSTKIHPAKIFNLLNTTGKLKYIFEQMVIAQYLSLMYPEPDPFLIEYYNSVRDLISTANKLALVEAKDKMIFNLISSLFKTPIPVNEIVSILSTDKDLGVHGEVYNSSDEIIAGVVNLIYELTDFPVAKNEDDDKDIASGILLFPKLVSGFDSESDCDFTIIKCSASIITLDRDKTLTGNTAILTLVNRMKRHLTSVDELVGILSNLSFGGMNTKDLTLADICKLSMRVTKNTIPSANSVPKEFYPFLDIVKESYTKGYFTGNTDTIGLLLKIIGDYEMVSDYLTKDVKDITATESLAFESSRFNYLPDRKAEMLASVMEDDMNDNKSEDLNDSPDDDPSITLDDSDESDSDTASDTDLATEDDSDDENEEPKVKDSTRQLIELDNDNTTLTDYMYRTLVLERLIHVIKNPPANIPSLELLLMKKWITCWINMVSVESLKDYVSRLSFRLMDTVPAKDGDLLTVGNKDTTN